MSLPKQKMMTFSAMELMQAVCECLCVDPESSGLETSRFSKCSSCKFGAECDEDSEDIWLVNMCFVFVYYRGEAPKIP